MENKIPPEIILREIASLISLHSFQMSPPMTDRDPDAFKNAWDQLERLASSLSKTIPDIPDREVARQISKTIVLLTTAVNNRILKCEWLPDGKQGRSDDELLCNRPGFAAIKDALDDEGLDPWELAIDVEAASMLSTPNIILKVAEFADLAKMDAGAVSRLKEPLTVENALRRRKTKKREAASENARKGASARRTRTQPKPIGWKCHRGHKFSDDYEKCPTCGSNDLTPQFHPKR